MISSGFFTQLFQQFVSLLSAFCIAPSGGLPSDAARALDSSPPAAAAAIAAPRTSLPPIVQTQINGALEIGYFTARTADRATMVVLESPRVLAESLDRNGLAGLPGGGATVAAGYVGLAEVTATGLIRLLSGLALSELDLIAPDRGVPLLAAAADYQIDVAKMEPQSYLERVLRTQVDGVTSVAEAGLGAVTGLGTAVLAAPNIVNRYIAGAGLAALPAGLAAAGREVVYALGDGSVRVIRAVADFARAELALVPGASVRGGGDVYAVAKFEPVGTSVGPVEMLVRIPLAVAVAASGLTMAAMRATTRVTGAATTAVTDVVRAVTNPLADYTLPQAIARVPETLTQGLADAGATLQYGVERARTDFRATLRGRNAVAELSDTTLRVSGGAEIRSSTIAGDGDDQGDGSADPSAGGDAGAQQPSDAGEPTTPDPSTDAGAAADTDSEGAEAAA